MVLTIKIKKEAAYSNKGYTIAATGKTKSYSSS